MSEWAFFGKCFSKGNYGEVLWKGDDRVLVKPVDYITEYDIVKGHIMLLRDEEVMICPSKEEARKMANDWASDTAEARAKITVQEKNIDAKWAKLKKASST